MKKSLLITAVGVFLSLPVHAGCKFGGGECAPGFVWREAVAGDNVCVSGTVRQQAARNNASQRGRVAPPPPGGNRPAFACSNGYVPRGAAAGDNVCVTPETRDQVLADNAAAASRVGEQCGDVGSLCALSALDRRDKKVIQTFDCPESTTCQPDLGCVPSKVSGCQGVSNCL